MIINLLTTKPNQIMSFPFSTYEAKLLAVLQSVKELLKERDLENLYCEDFIENEFLDRQRIWFTSYEIAIQIFDCIIFMNNSQIYISDEF